MNRLLYIGMDVHKESFTLSTYHVTLDENELTQDFTGDPLKITDATASGVEKYIKNLKKMLNIKATDNIRIQCGYEAGCLGFDLHFQLKAKGIECVILAPSTIQKSANAKKKKNDPLDSKAIAMALANKTYKSVHVPDKDDLNVREYLRMRNAHKDAVKKVKQQILAFLLRQGIKYSATNWTKAHITWLHGLKFDHVLLKETLDEYITSLENYTAKLERLDKRIGEFAQGDKYQEKVAELGCLLGIKTQAAMTMISEISDFSRFRTASEFASFLGLVPGENSSGEKTQRTSITKSGNSQCRKTLIEAAAGICRGKVGHKSKELLRRQALCNNPIAISYADRANERLRSKFYRLNLRNKKPANVAKTAVARELACFIWGIMTDTYDGKVPRSDEYALGK